MSIEAKRKLEEEAEERAAHLKRQLVLSWPWKKRISDGEFNGNVWSLLDDVKDEERNSDISGRVSVPADGVQDGEFDGNVWSLLDDVKGEERNSDSSGAAHVPAGDVTVEECLSDSFGRVPSTVFEEGDYGVTSAEESEAENSRDESRSAEKSREQSGSAHDDQQREPRLVAAGGLERRYWRQHTLHALLLQAGWTENIEFLEDDRVQAMRDAVLQKRQEYCDLKRLPADSVLTASQASEIIAGWRHESVAGNQGSSNRKGKRRKKAPRKRKLFSDYLYEVYGGYKIVQVLLRAGVMDAALVKSYAQEILKGRPPKASGGVPVPAVPTARTAPPKSVRRETRWSENRLWTCTDRRKPCRITDVVAPWRIQRGKCAGRCQRCGNDWANAGECEVCHVVCGRCCIWDGHGVCQDCPKIDRRREYGSFDFAVDRVIYHWQQTRAYVSLKAE